MKLIILGVKQKLPINRTGRAEDEGANEDVKTSVPIIVGPQFSRFGGEAVWKVACGPSHVRTKPTCCYRVMFVWCWLVIIVLHVLFKLVRLWYAGPATYGYKYDISL